MEKLLDLKTDQYFQKPHCLGHSKEKGTAPRTTKATKGGLHNFEGSYATSGHLQHGAQHRGPACPGVKGGFV